MLALIDDDEKRERERRGRRENVLWREKGRNAGSSVEREGGGNGLFAISRRRKEGKGAGGSTEKGAKLLEERRKKCLRKA